MSRSFFYEGPAYIVEVRRYNGGRIISALVIDSLTARTLQYFDAAAANDLAGALSLEPSDSTVKRFLS